MSLLQRLQLASYTGSAILGGANNTAHSFTQLIAKAQQLRAQYPQLKSCAIALPYRDLASFTATLLALDGWCSTLYLWPEQGVTLPATVHVWPQEATGHNDEITSACPSARTIATDSCTPSLPTQWLLATSGTTGTPKWIAHNIESLTRALSNTPDNRRLRWALCYQPCRFAGIQVLLQSLLSGATLVDCSAGDMASRVRRMQDHAITAISATPSFWRQLLMTTELSALPLTHITLGGEIADQTLLDKLAHAHPNAKILHIYASTEAGVGFAVADKRAGFPRTWLATGYQGLRLKIDERHHLWLKPRNMLTSSSRLSSDSTGFLDTGDQVSVTAERVLFLGRATGVINVGGNKVYPEQVEHVLLMHPQVTATRVYAKRSSILGELVTADVVPNKANDLPLLKKQLIAHCAGYLQRYQLPTQLYFVESLPIDTTGKLSRRNKDTLHD